MSYYLDTSALVSVLANEPDAPSVNAWLRKQEPATVLLSEWTHTEVASALALKLRTGELTLETRAEAASVFAKLVSTSLPTLAVLPEHFETAARFAAQHELGLRGPDALHLAVARQSGSAVVTLDRQMAQAALELGIPVERI